MYKMKGMITALIKSEFPNGICMFVPVHLYYGLKFSFSDLFFKILFEKQLKGGYRK